MSRFFTLLCAIIALESATGSVINFACPTYGQTHGVYAIFTPDFAYERYRAVLRFYTNLIATECESNDYIETIFIGAFSFNLLKCKGNTSEYINCITNLTTHAYTDSIQTTNRSNPLLTLRSFSSTFQNEPSATFWYRQMTRLIIFTDSKTFWTPLFGIDGDWLRNANNSFGKIEDSDENYSLITIITDDNDTSTFYDRALDAWQSDPLLNAIGFRYKVININKTSENTTLGFCTEEQTNIYVALSNNLPPSRQSGVHEFILDFVDRRKYFNETGALSIVARIRYFQMAVYKPYGMNLVSIAKLDCPPPMQYVKTCISSNLETLTRTGNLSSDLDYGSVIKCNSEPFGQSMLKTLPNSVVKRNTVLITDLEFGCLTRTFVNLSTLATPTSVDILFLNDVDIESTVLKQLHKQYLTFAEDNQQNVHYFVMKNPDAMLVNERWRAQFAFGMQESRSMELVATKSTKSEIFRGKWKLPFYLYIVIFVFALATIISLFFGVRWYRRRRIIRSLKANFERTVETNIYPHLGNKHSLNRNDIFIEFDRELGHGAFSKVYKGKLAQQTPRKESVSSHIAVKIPNQMTYEEVGQIEREMAIMSQLKRHANILQFIGYVKESDFLALVLELAHQTLLTYAKTADRVVICSRQTSTILRQVASGMAFLVSQQFVHRDLASRNVLLTEHFCAKISDFGLCCRPCDDTLYYVETLNRRLPLKWMSLEAILDHKFGEKSDVWSFGVVMYEVYSCGLIPYEDIPNQDLKQYLMDGHRLSQPEFANDLVYEIMKSCWKLDTKERPNFSDLHNQLEEFSNDQALLYGYVSANE